MKPKLRGVEAQQITHRGQPLLVLRDPLRLGDTAVAVPPPLGPLLGLMDGSRDVSELEAAFRVRTGIGLAPGLLTKLLADLDQAYLLDNERSSEGKLLALRQYQTAACRAMTVDGGSFPNDPDSASACLRSFGGATPATCADEWQDIRGLLSPHIDYQRGGRVYAQVWWEAVDAVQQADLVVILGTDHHGSDGTFSLTRQSYATPWGVLPTDSEVVRCLSLALGEEAAFSEELHHRDEHSIELAAVWLHFVRAGKPVALVPVLCGGLESTLCGEKEPGHHEPAGAALAVLKQVMASRRTLVVAAADLAHVGPAFGDAQALDFVGRARLRTNDEDLLAKVCQGDAQGFLTHIRRDDNGRHVCGVAPIYYMLRLLEATTGTVTGYELCPADPQGGSLVSIAGALFR